MPKYIIERDVPGAGNFSKQDLHDISQKSVNVIESLGPRIQWLETYVTDNKLYCIYIAPSEHLIREHAREGRFPANRISEIKAIIDPTDAEQ